MAMKAVRAADALLLRPTGRQLRRVTAAARSTAAEPVPMEVTVQKRKDDLAALENALARGRAEKPKPKPKGGASAAQLSELAKLQAVLSSPTGSAWDVKPEAPAPPADKAPEAASSAPGDACPEEAAADPLHEEQLALERIWRFDLGEELDLIESERRANAVNAFAEEVGGEGKKAVLVMLDALWEELQVHIDALVAQRPELKAIVLSKLSHKDDRGETAAAEKEFDMADVAGEVLAQVPTEDEVLCSLTRRVTGQLAGGIFSAVAQGLSSKNNYNKTKEKDLVRDPSALDKFTLPVLLGGGSRGTYVYDPERTSPTEFAAVCHAYLAEMETRKLSLTEDAGTAKGKMQQLQDSFTLQALCGRLRLTATSDAGLGAMEEYIVAMHDEPFASKAAQAEWVERELLEAARDGHSKWQMEHCMAHIVLKEVALEYDQALKTVKDKLASQHRGAAPSHDANPDTTALEVPDYVKEIPEAVRAAVRFALDTRDILHDRYVPCQNLVKRLALNMKNAEMEHPVLGQNQQNRIDQIPTQPRHYQAAGSLIEILSRVRYDGMRPFSIEHLMLRGGRGGGVARGEVHTTVILRVDPFALKGDVQPMTFSASSDYPPMVAPPDSWAKEKQHPHKPMQRMRSPYKTLPADLLRPVPEARWVTNELVKALGPVLPHLPVVKSLDYLAGIKWQVSQTALDHLCWAKKVGLDLGDKLKGGWEPVLPPPPKYRTPKAMSLWRAECEATQKKVSARRNAVQTSDVLVDLLGRFSDKDNTKHLYLPTNCDFRGRTYPLHSGLNYQASDFVRSSLEFGEKRPITKAGLRHMKIHTANLMGLDKASFSDRIKWVDDNIEEIIRCKENPRAPDALWLKADKPLLGYVMLCEMANAYSHSRGPEHYETAAPIHVDGSCNGLQHYSAIALDDKGAATANLTKKSDDEKPSDVYSTVLEYVKLHNLEVINEGGKLATIAAQVHPMLKRKTVKQSVMTNVYGVTMMGMVEQVRGQLTAQAEDMLHPPSPTDIARMSTHICKLILRSLSDVFKGAIEVQSWFKASIKTIREAHTKGGIQAAPITFMSPAGVPVCQPYFRSMRKSCSVRVGITSLSFEYVARDSDMAFAKHTTAFPPNFVHSMDASHVHLTCAKLAELGVKDFGCVHDSFWGHASDMDTVNDVLRQSFVDLYAPNRLEALYLDLSSSYGKALQRAGMSLPLPPERGTFDLTEVLDAPYFFA
eukprot:TRINITY_DN2644_c0_g3_i1.p1 TRINITY_DN2644_c0_g3~~TRINITY_DN2644_c0_g3_i1.p1  ORF type:complete len:1215 (+),score=412.69 TRINITY_DN2644_c0_g3_i1:117-3761(+)